MPTTRDTYKYHFKKGNEIVQTGITNDIDRREYQHRRKKSWSDGCMTQVGHRTTYDSALEWVRNQAKLGKPVRRSDLNLKTTS